MNSFERAAELLSVRDAIIRGEGDSDILASHESLSRSKLGRIRRKLGVIRDRGRPPKKFGKSSLMVIEFLSSHKNNNMTLSEVGDRFSISRQRVHQILYPLKHKARTAVWLALKSKAISKPKTCSECLKKKKLESHHDDYSKPLDVIWLCHKCHSKRLGFGRNHRRCIQPALNELNGYYSKPSISNMPEK